MITRLGQLLIKQAEKQNTNHHYLTPTHFALIKYAAVMEKLAARWHDMFANLSPANKARILQSGIAKTPDQIADGINRGTRRMMKQIGYTESDISGPTLAQIHTAKKRTQKQISRALRMGDKAAVERNLATLKMFKAPIGQIHTNNDIMRSASTNHPLKMMFTANPGKDGKKHDKLTNAFIRRHELYESQAGNANALKFYNNKTEMRELNKQRINEYVNNLTLTDNLTTHGRITLRKRMTQNRLQSSPGLPQDNDLILSHISEHPGRIIHSYEPLNAHKEIGSHNDINVLIKERKLLDRIPYETPELQKIRHYRNTPIGEYEYMNEAGHYDPDQQLERFGKQNVKNLLHNSRKSIHTSRGGIMKPMW